MRHSTPGLTGVVRLFVYLLPLLAAWPALAEEPRFNTSSLESLLQKSPVTGLPVDSINELLPLLPRELLSNFTFVYDSRSPFRPSISPEFPRVVLFTEDARLVLTFTADPDKPGLNVLESLSFDDGTARFEPHVYPLPAAERLGWQPARDNSNCSSCHGADPRPIFDSYPVWPGFYGSVLDTFAKDRTGRNEAANYRFFLTHAARTEPYKYLIFPSGSAVTPYLDPHNSKRDATELEPSDMRFLPNTRLGMALSELNSARIYRKLAAGKNFTAGEKHLLAELLECKRVEIPGRAEMRPVEQQLRRENNARLRRLPFHKDGQISGNEDMEELQLTRELTEIMKVARDADADPSDWSMALDPGSLAFFDGILSGIHAGKSYYLKEQLIYEILRDLAGREPAFQQYFQVAHVFAGLGYSFGTRIALGKALASCRLLTQN